MSACEKWAIFGEIEIDVNLMCAGWRSEGGNSDWKRVAISICQLLAEFCRQPTDRLKCVGNIQKIVQLPTRAHRNRRAYKKFIWIGNFAHIFEHPRAKPLPGLLAIKNMLLGCVSFHYLSVTFIIITKLRSLQQYGEKRRRLIIESGAVNNLALN